MKFKALLTAVLLALVLIPGPAAAVDQWEVPFLNSWTGVAAGYGKLCDFFQKYAVEEINAAGGIAGKPLVVQDCDTAMDPTRAASCMKKAVESSLVVIGPMTSLSTQVCAPIAAKAGVMTLPVAGGYETIKDSRPWAVVLMIPNQRRAQFTMNTWLDQNPNVKSVVMLGFPKVAQWTKLGDLQKEALEKRGVKVLENIDVQSGAVDVSSVVVRAMKSKPDGIVTRLMIPDTVRIISELTKRGWKDKGAIFNHSSADSPELYSMSAEAGNVLEGTYIGSWGPGQDSEAYRNLLAAFKKIKGQENATGLMWGDLFYVATWMVKAAIEGTGVTGDPAKLQEERVKIRDYINSMKNFDSRVRGPIDARPDGTFTVPIFLARIENNKPVIVASSKDFKE